MKIQCRTSLIQSGYIIGCVVKDDITYALVADRYDGAIHEIERQAVFVDKEEL